MRECGRMRLQATDLARQMVTKYGMSEVLGQVSIEYEDDGRSLSSETRSAVESEVYLQGSAPSQFLNQYPRSGWAGSKPRHALQCLRVLRGAHDVLPGQGLGFRV